MGAEEVYKGYSQDRTNTDDRPAFRARIARVSTFVPNSPASFDGIHFVSNDIVDPFIDELDDDSLHEAHRKFEEMEVEQRVMRIVEFCRSLLK